jgi:hypothetical protein
VISPCPNVKVAKAFVAESRIVRKFSPLYIASGPMVDYSVHPHPLNPPKSEKNHDLTTWPVSCIVLE